MSELRTFIAVEVDEAVKKNLTEFLNRLKETSSDVRWVDVQNIHITLKFLGYIEEAHLSAVKEIIRKAIKGIRPFTIKFRGAGAFPKLERPRVVFVSAEDNSGSLSKVQSQLEEGLAELGIEKEDRPYHPHLTLGRVKSIQNIEALVKLMARYTGHDFGEEQVSRVVLMQSQLTPKGPTYTELDKFPLV